MGSFSSGCGDKRRKIDVGNLKREENWILSCFIFCTQFLLLYYKRFSSYFIIQFKTFSHSFIHSFICMIFFSFSFHFFFFRNFLTILYMRRFNWKKMIMVFIIMAMMIAPMMVMMMWIHFWFVSYKHLNNERKYYVFFFLSLSVLISIQFIQSFSSVFLCFFFLDWIIFLFFLGWRYSFTFFNKIKFNLSELSVFDLIKLK